MLASLLLIVAIGGGGFSSTTTTTTGGDDDDDPYTAPRMSIATSAATVIPIGDNRTRINQLQFEQIVRAVESNGDDESSCAYNIPDSPFDVLPQILGIGIGFEFIRLARDAYRFELVAAGIVAPIIEDLALERISTDQLTQRSELFKKMFTILKSGLLDNFKTIMSAYVCIHKEDVHQFAFCDGATRHGKISTDANFDILYRFRVMDALYFINEQKLEEKRSSGRKNGDAGWWFGPTFCKSDRYKMVFALPLTTSGTLIISFNISMVDLNQCDPNQPFGVTNKCPIGTKCVTANGNGFKIGSYNCVCSSPTGHEFSFDGRNLEKSYLNRTSDGAWCPFTCLSGSQCFVRPNGVLRLVIISFQALCICLVVFEMILVFKKRHNKAMKLAMWTMNEALLMGTICIYLSVIVMCLDTNVVTCLAYSWLREVGFITVYGTLVLRLYKLLAEFQSRKARSVQIKNKDMIRYLFLMIFTTVFYLLSWTLVNLDHANDPHIALSLLYYGRTKSGYDFVSCQLRWWDYLIEIAEFAFLCTALRLLYCTKTAPPSEYKERKFIAFAIYLEITISTLCNLTRLGIWKTVHPNALLVIYFFRSHFTITTAIVFNMYRRILCSLCFGDKSRDDQRFKSIQDTSGEADFSGFKMCNNGDVSSIAEMDPETIKTELKRLYSQLHHLKTEQMKRYNPHLVRKSNRKRNRRISVQALKHRANTIAATQETPENEISVQKTPRDSVASILNAEKGEMA
ncbi:hypothetical protein ACOME3_008707 [Neoechinorhynchus agilis]